MNMPRPRRLRAGERLAVSASRPYRLRADGGLAANMPRPRRLRVGERLAVNAPRPHAGFTLIETMVVLAVAVILLSIAAPNLQALIRQQQLRAAVADLAVALATVRTQAIARGRIVQIVPADAAGVDWRSGWVVFADRDGDLLPSAGDDIIARHPPLPEGIAVAFDFSSHHAPSYIAYNAAGRSCSADNGAAAQFGTLSLFQGERTRRLKINMLGRVRVCDPASDGADCSGAADGE